LSYMGFLHHGPFEMESGMWKGNFGAGRKFG
jgi:hypothetical protein